MQNNNLLEQNDQLEARSSIQNMVTFSSNHLHRFKDLKANKSSETKPKMHQIPQTSFLLTTYLGSLDHLKNRIHLHRLRIYTPFELVAIGTTSNQGAGHLQML